MEYIRITKENIDKEHICCAMSGKQSLAKKEWLKQRFEEGLVFYRSAERGKCFIEYIPAENAWVPIDAAGWLYINCLWVSGSFKGHGYSNELLKACINDAKEKGKKGITVISSPKKKPFLSDPKYLAYKGFKVADTAEPYYTLLYLPFDENTEMPKFKESAKNPHISEQGFVLYYTAGCPYTAKYAPLIEERARQNGIPFKSIHIDNNVISFGNGAITTAEIQNSTRGINFNRNIYAPKVYGAVWQ